MKNLKYAMLLSLLVPFFCLAQRIDSGTAVPVIYISTKSAVHLRSPEPISYVDLPRSSLSADLPKTNLLRLRTNLNPFDPKSSQLGVITITGEHFIAQYELVLLAPDVPGAHTELEILPHHMKTLIPDLPTLSMPQMHRKALEAISKKVAKPLSSNENQRVCIALNQILSCGDLVFLDLSFINRSSLDYHIERVAFTISDKKISKATNTQQYPLEPKLILYPLGRFTKQSRNIFVLPKAMFSSSKQLIISLAEQQPSSRRVELAIDYLAILSADTF